MKPNTSGYYWFIGPDRHDWKMVKVVMREETGSAYVLEPGNGHAVPLSDWPAGYWEGPLYP